MTPHQNPFEEAYPHLKEFTAFLEILNKESERGAALIAASMVDDLLGRCIRSYLLEHKDEASEQTIMSIAGHVSREMLEHYSHIRREARRKAVASIDNVTITSQLAKWKEEADGRRRLELKQKTKKSMVGTGRFELPTPRTPSECSTRLSHVPTKRIRCHTSWG
jgi:hypothetical protein